MRKSLFVTTASAIALSLAAMAAPVFAQSGSGNGSGMQSQSSKAEASHISSDQVKKFAKTQSDMQKLVRSSQQKINKAGNQKEAKQQRHKMNSQIIQTIKKNGLTVEQFNKIAQASRNNQQLRQRIEKALPH